MDFRSVYKNICSVKNEYLLDKKRIFVQYKLNIYMIRISFLLGNFVLYCSVHFQFQGRWVKKKLFKAFHIIVSDTCSWSCLNIWKNVTFNHNIVNSTCIITKTQRPSTCHINHYIIILKMLPLMNMYLRFKFESHKFSIYSTFTFICQLSIIPSNYFCYRANIFFIG